MNKFHQGWKQNKGVAYTVDSKKIGSYLKGKRLVNVVEETKETLLWLALMFLMIATMYIALIVFI